MQLLLRERIGLEMGRQQNFKLGQYQNIIQSHLSMRCIPLKTGLCETRFFKLRLQSVSKVETETFDDGLSFETETEIFTPWYQILRLRLWIWVSNFETETETLLVWSQTLNPRLRPAKSQILKLRLMRHETYMPKTTYFVCCNGTNVIMGDIAFRIWPKSETANLVN